MAQLNLIAALMLATSQQPAAADRPMAAPPGTPDTRYCMRVEPVTGSRIERVRCWTRDEWADQGVDVDLDWAEEGVRVEG